jgi:hypothetical protein
MMNSRKVYIKTVGMLEEKEQLRAEIEATKKEVAILKDKVNILSERPPEKVYVKKFGYEKSIWRMIFTEALKVGVVTLTTLQINKLLGRRRDNK